MNTEKTRIQWIDFARAMAICMVVLCHAAEAVYPLLRTESILALPVPSRIFGIASFSCGRLGVPLFLMISGSLLLTRDYDDEGIKQFLKKKWLHLLICTLIWFTIYDIFLRCYYHESIDVFRYIEEMFFLRKVNMSHIWYLPTILGLYVTLPFVSTVLKKHSDRVFIFPLAFSTLYIFGAPTLYVIVKCLFPQVSLQSQFSEGFSGGVYGLTILYGYFIKKGVFEKIRTPYIAVVSIISFAEVVLIQLLAYQKGSSYTVWYDNLFLLIASVGIFELCRRMKHIYGYKVIKVISRYSFPIFLIHNVIRAMIRGQIALTSLRRTFQVLLIWAICFFASLLISWLISKIPRIGRYILYM